MVNEIMMGAFNDELEKIALGPETWSRGMRAARERIRKPDPYGANRAKLHAKLKSIEEMLSANQVAAAKRKKVSGRTDAEAAYDRTQNRNQFNSRRQDLDVVNSMNNRAMDTAHRKTLDRFARGFPPTRPKRGGRQ